MSFGIIAGVIGGLLAIVSVGAGLAVLILSDRRSAGLATLNIEPRTVWRLRAMLCLAAAATVILVGFAIACARF